MLILCQYICDIHLFDKYTCHVKILVRCYYALCVFHALAFCVCLSMVSHSVLFVSEYGLPYLISLHCICCVVNQQFWSILWFCSSVGTGPRLSSFLVEVTEQGNLNLEDIDHFIPLQSHQSVQLCAFVFHDIPEVIHQLPCNVTVAEYGFQVHKLLEIGKN